MSNSLWIKRLKKETGQSDKLILSIWEQAKIITEEDFGVVEEDFGQKEYKYAYELSLEMIRDRESVGKPMDFINSDLCADKFIESLLKKDEETSVTVSSQFSPSLDNTIKKSKDLEDDPDEESDPVESEVDLDNPVFFGDMPEEDLVANLDDIFDQYDKNF